MPNAAERDEFTDRARSRLAAGSGIDDVLRELRESGLDKPDCIEVLHLATGISRADAKIRVHHSAAWSDRREVDEYLEDQFWRAAFILCLVDGGDVREPAEWVAEFRQRRTRATEQLRAIAARVPAEVAADCLRSIDDQHLGDAFEALVCTGERDGMDDEYWQALSAASRTLCLDEAGDLHKSEVVRERIDESKSDGR